MADEREAEPIDERLLERMLFFSDAVFAIVLTLLALDLHLPQGTDDAHLLAGIEAARDSLIAFVVSFGLVGFFWLMHVITLRALATFDWMAAALNVVLLFTVTLTPFATEMVRHLGRHGEAWRLYCLTMIVMSLALCALIAVSHRDQPRFLHRAYHGQLRHRLSRAITPGVAFTVGLTLSFVGLPVLASLCWMLVPVLLLMVKFAGIPATPRPDQRATPP
jgi:uncharacterized membrane protein